MQGTAAPGYLVAPDTLPNPGSGRIARYTLHGIHKKERHRQSTVGGHEIQLLRPRGVRGDTAKC